MHPLSDQLEIVAPQLDPSSRASAKRILDTFSAHDAKANAALDDETYENWDGSVKGPVQDEKSGREFLERRKDVQRTMLEEIGIVQVTPDVAILQVSR